MKTEKEEMNCIKSVYNDTAERLSQVEIDLQMQPSDMVYAALIGRKYAYLEVLEMIKERSGYEKKVRKSKNHV